MLTGKLEKIREVDKKRLNALLEIKNYNDFLPLEILEEMKLFCNKYGEKIGFVLSKDNKVEEIFIGVGVKDIQSVLDDVDYLTDFKVFICEQCNEPKFSEMEKSYLKSRFLTSLTKIAIEDDFKGAVVLLNAFDGYKQKVVESVEYINKYGINDEILTYQKDFRDNYKTDNSTGDVMQKAVLIGIGRRGEDIARGLDELQLLAETVAIEVVGRFEQTRKVPDQQYHIGCGKLDEISELIISKHANLIIVDDELNGQRLFNLEEALNVKVIDRCMLILDIFAKRANSNEGRLQVRLAQMKYSYPRLIAYQSSSGRFGSGGVGMRGPGESKLEISKRNLKFNIYKTEQEIDKLKKQRELRRQKRKANNEKIVALVGYTNSGKSTILNILTNANVLAENKLFATLDTTTREFYLDDKNKCLLIDTVGFIDKLPHAFIDAFSSTLEESLFANLILVVVDNSHPNAQMQYEVVQKVLSELNADKIPQIVVFNKSDKKASSSFEVDVDSILVSAKNGANLDALRKMIKNKIFD